MISSPSATSIGTSSPLSLRPPGPTASTRPRCGFSFAVSGRTMPLAVVSSSSRASTIRRSPSGCRFIQPLLRFCDFVTLPGTLGCRVPDHFTASTGGHATTWSSARRFCYKRGMKREFSAGGVLIRRLQGRWVFAAIRPAGKKPGLWALPKGQIGPGEKPEATALREVAEETGAASKLESKLGDVKYVYTWDGERIFKVVSFYLLRYSSGRLGELPPETAHEVDEVRWLPLEEGPRLLAYGGEREMAAKAVEAVRAL